MDNYIVCFTARQTAPIRVIRSTGKKCCGLIANSPVRPEGVLSFTAPFASICICLHWHAKLGFFEISNNVNPHDVRAHCPHRRSLHALPRSRHLAYLRSDGAGSRPRAHARHRAPRRCPRRADDARREGLADAESCRRHPTARCARVRLVERGPPRHRSFRLRDRLPPSHRPRRNLGPSADASGRKHHQHRGSRQE